MPSLRRLVARRPALVFVPAATLTAALSTGLPTPLVPIGVNAIGFPSSDCSSNVVADGYAGSTYVKLRADQPDPSDLWVCLRADNGGGLNAGGKFVISTPGASLPALPTVDGNWQAC